MHVHNTVNSKACMVQVMGSKKCKDIEKAIDKERGEGRATYFGESLELVSYLQLTQLCDPSSSLPRLSIRESKQVSLNDENLHAGIKARG